MWVLEAFLRYLRVERKFSEKTIEYRSQHLSPFLQSFEAQVGRERFRALKPETAEKLIRQHFRNSTSNPGTSASILRQFFRFCAERHYTKTDFSGLIPSIRKYRHATLPKGMEDSALQRMLKAIPRDNPIGARDYAIIVLMMAYGVRGISAAQLLLDDIDWQNSRVRIRAQKGGKEVVLPLTEAVGEAIIEYLKSRKAHTPFREVFLSARPPFRPLNSCAISRIVRNYLEKAGIKIPGSGSHTLRHSWAIRALAHDSSIKAIADVLGHRYIDTTFIYAKADLNSLREVALPWPEKD